MMQALDRVPDWPAGWAQLGAYAERAGEIGVALNAWRRLLELDEDGVFGARLKLAAHGAGEAVAATDTAFVAALFDDYAPRFETALLQRLHYEVPGGLAALVADDLQRTGTCQLAHAIDLGCGTGLMGERLRHQVSFLEGVDLSAAMIEESRRKGIYDRLEHCELTRFLAGHAGTVDLLAASDVFNYCGALAPVLAAAWQALRSGGLLAFSLEAHDGPEPLILRPTLRFAHEGSAARAALTSAGFEVRRFENAVLRLDRGEPVPGYLVLARKAASLMSVAATAVEPASEAAVLH